MEDQFNLIDRYLLGKLNPEELKTFEQQMKMDQPLKNQVEQQRKAMQFLEIVRDNEMKDKLKTIHQDVRAQGEAKTQSLAGRRRWLWGTLSGAAAILLLILAYNIFSKTSSPQDLYVAYYQTYPVLTASRSQDSNPDLVQATQLYQQKNYTAALALFQKLNPLSEDKMIPLAIGFCQLELNDPQNAIPQFQALVNDPLYQEPAEWYLALAYLKINESEKSKTILMDIKENAAFYQQAQSLLRKFPK